MVFVTGANGLLGSFICRKLLKAGYSVRALKRANSKLHLVDDIKHLIEWTEGDILDFKSIEKQLEGVSTVIHCAALVSYNKKDRQALFKTNVEGTANIVNICINAGITNIVYISSIATIGKNRSYPFSDEETQWSNTEPSTEYARTKYLAELEVWRGAAEGLKPVIINPSVILGPGEWNKSSTKLFKYILDEKPFYIDGNLNFVDVRDVAEIVVHLLNKNIYNERFIINADNITYNDLFIKIAEAFHKRPPWIKVPLELVKMFTWVDKGISWLLRKEPILENDLSAVVKNKHIYDNTKIRNFINYNFRNIDDTINWSSDALLKKIEL